MTLTHTHTYLPHSPAVLPLCSQPGCWLLTHTYTHTHPHSGQSVEQQVCWLGRCGAGCVSVWPVLHLLSYSTSWIKTDRLTLSQAYSCHHSSNTPSTSSHTTLCPVSSLVLLSRVMVRQTTRWSESACNCPAEVYLGKTLNPQQVQGCCSAADPSLWSASGKRQAKRQNYHIIVIIIKLLHIVFKLV